MRQAIFRTAAAAVVPLVALVISAPSGTPAHAESAVRPTKETVRPVTSRPATTTSRNATRSAAFEVPGLDRDVLETALAANDCATERGLVKRPEVLTVIDYSLPSTERRLWVLDLDRQQVLYNELVSHGKNSGADRAQSFSNVSMSLESNIGLMTTAETYYGKNGYSLRMDGLEPGFNDQARPRAIVIHGADYVSEKFVRRIGRLGRSWGCPALDMAVHREVIDTIKGGSLVFGYYPDQDWLSKSDFVRCAAERGTKIAGTGTAGTTRAGKR